MSEPRARRRGVLTVRELAAALRPRAHGRDRRRRARPGHQGRPLLGRRRPGARTSRARACSSTRGAPGTRTPPWACGSWTASRASTRRRWWSRWGTSWTRCRAELVERAKELKLPVLTLPAGALTRSVLSYVYNVLASADLHRLRRTVALQNDLLDLLIAEAGRRRAAGQGGDPHRHADAAARRRRRRRHQLGRRPTRGAVRAEVWEAWAELTDATRARHRRGGRRRGTSAARSSSTASWSGSSSRRRRRPRAPSSSTRRCRSSSG